MVHEYHKEIITAASRLRGITSSRSTMTGGAQYAEEFSKNTLGRTKEPCTGIWKAATKRWHGRTGWAGRTDAMTAFHGAGIGAGNRSRQACSRHSSRKSNRRSEYLVPQRILRRTTARGKCFTKARAFSRNERMGLHTVVPVRDATSTIDDGRRHGQCPLWRRAGIRNIRTGKL